MSVRPWSQRWNMVKSCRTEPYSSFLISRKVRRSLCLVTVNYNCAVYFDYKQTRTNTQLCGSSILYYRFQLRGKPTATFFAMIYVKVLLRIDAFSISWTNTLLVKYIPLLRLFFDSQITALCKFSQLKEMLGFSIITKKGGVSDVFLISEVYVFVIQRRLLWNTLSKKL